MRTAGPSRQWRGGMPARKGKVREGSSSIYCPHPIAFRNGADDAVSTPAPPDTCLVSRSSF